MRVLDLFAGLGGWSAPFRARGHDVVTVDVEQRFMPELLADVLTLRARDLPWRPDVVLASPPCEAFSVMSIGHHWSAGYVPKTADAWQALGLVIALRRLLVELEPRWYAIENPRGMLRMLWPLADLERRTVTYCAYGAPSMKPTDLWGGFPPSFVTRPMCSKGDSCHIAAPRGSRTGIQGPADAAQRALVPFELGADLAIAAEHDLTEPTPMRLQTERLVLW